jgi:hypothetical protein
VGHTSLLGHRPDVIRRGVTPNLTGLRRMNAGGGDLGDFFNEFDSPTFSNLRWLNLSDNPNSDHNPPDITSIFSSRHLANLEYLGLGHTDLDAGCLRALTTTTELRRLRRLNVSRSRLSRALPDFFQTPSLPALAELDLSDSIASERGKPEPDVDKYLTLLADSPLFARLTTLALGQNHIRDSGARILAASPREVRFSRLNLYGNGIGTEVRRLLEKRFGPDVCVYRRPERL